MKRVALIATLTVLALAAINACGGDEDGGETATPAATATPTGTGDAGTATPDGTDDAESALRSDAFDEGGEIPERYTCDGENISPPLTWNEPPEGLEFASYLLIADDPDAPGDTFTHWVYYDIPGEERGLVEGIPQGDEPALGGRQGVNDFGNTGYDGPCPPEGEEHEYVFSVYALDATIELPAGATAEEALDAISGNIIGFARLSGTYAR
jgi:Raf kinase inhibitor-like YbhB/YbcL family protein